MAKNTSGLIAAIKKNPSKFDPKGLLLSELESVFESISKTNPVDGGYLLWSCDYDSLLIQARENGVYFAPEELEEEEEPDYGEKSFFEKDDDEPIEEEEE
jgi:hypothetical protein